MKFGNGPRRRVRGGSALKLCPLLCIQRFFKEENNQCKRHRGFCRGDGDEDNCESFAAVIEPVAAERDKRNSGGLEHQVGAEEHDDQVAAGEETDQADREHLAQVTNR